MHTTERGIASRTGKKNPAKQVNINKQKKFKNKEQKHIAVKKRNCTQYSNYFWTQQRPTSPKTRPDKPGTSRYKHNPYINGLQNKKSAQIRWRTEEISLERVLHPQGEVK